LKYFCTCSGRANGQGAVARRLTAFGRQPQLVILPHDGVASA
jgi:hypothetical protein